MLRGILILLFFSRPAAGQFQQVDSAILTVYQDLSLQKEEQTNWSKICSGLKKEFFRPVSGDGLSHFAKINCGDKEKSNNQNKLHYKLKVGLKPGAAGVIQFTLSMEFNSYSQVIKTIRYKTQRPPGEFVKDMRINQFARLIRLMTPYVGLVKVNQKKDSFSFQSSESGDFFAFSLKFNEKLGPQLKLLGKAQVRKGAIISIGQKTRSYDWSSVFMAREKKVFLDYVNLKDKKKALEEVAEQLLPKGDWWQKVAEAFNVVDSSYVGLRYALPLAKTDSIIGSSSYISTMIELRAGILSGLRFHYDIAPELKRSSEFGEEVFSWSRFGLGYSYGFSPGETLSKYISTDAQFKIGQSSMKANLAVEQSNFTSLEDFEVSNALNLGLGFNIEMERPPYRMRLFTELDLAGLKGSEDGFSVLKFSGDFYYTMVTKEKFSLSIMLAGSQEFFTVNRTEDPNSDQLTISALSYSLLYLSTGLVISW